MKFAELPYQTPRGFTDYPFAYVYDTSGIADASNVIDIAQQTQGDSTFVLRRICGVPNCVDTAANGGRFNYRNASGSYANGNVTTGIVVPKVWPVVPEKEYRYNDAIRFDLYQTLRAFNACGGTPIYKSVIAFMGVKRMPTNLGYMLRQTPYRYREVKYAYTYDLTVNWGYYTTFGGTDVAPAQRFSIQMEQYDFELMRLAITKTSPTQGTGALVTDDFAIQLYDPDMHAFSNAPMPQSYVNSARVSPAQGPTFAGAVWPVPSVVYPAGGQIVFDITSLKCPNAASTGYNILFDGIWRIPLNASR